VFYGHIRRATFIVCTVWDERNGYSVGDGVSDLHAWSIDKVFARCYHTRL